MCRHQSFFSRCTSDVLVVTIAKLTSLLLLAATALATPLPLRLLSWNLRYDSKPDSIPISETIATLPASIPTDQDVTYYSSPQEAPWSTRRIAVAQEVSFTQPTIIGFQEALTRQVHDLSDLFGDSYSWVGVGRDDGVRAGEYEAIFWRNDTLELLECDTFWLSPTPFKPSKFPGVGCVRTATRALFRPLTPRGRNFTVICTHWDHQSDPQRQLAASLILYRAAYEVCHHRGPVFVLGDFNSPSTGPDCGGYSIMTGLRGPVQIPADFHKKYATAEEKSQLFVDVANATEPVNRSGHHATFTGFERWEKMDLKRIDFVMAMGTAWSARRYRVGENWWDQGRLASDHRPVWVDIVVV